MANLLTLYKKDSCPYCLFVMKFIADNNIQVEMKDILQNQQALSELLEIGKKRQVPCLFIDGEALYESQDIIKWLEKNVC